MLRKYKKCNDKSAWSIVRELLRRELGANIDIANGAVDLEALELTGVCISTLMAAGQLLGIMS